MSDLMVGLKALTSYTMVVWASNGYNSTFATAEYSTSGLPLEEVGTGTYTYTCMFTDTVAVPGYSMYKDPNVEDTYKIAGWYDIAGASNIDFTFTWDGDSTVKVVNGQWIGIGEYYAGELSDLAGQVMNPSYYDAETKTFYFGIGYYKGNQFVGYGYETFTLDAEDAEGDAEGDTEAAAARQLRGMSASTLTAKWSAREMATFGPQVAGKAMARGMAKKAEFTAKYIAAPEKSMQFSNKKIVVE